MIDEECKAIEAECLKNVREAIKTITSGDIYDRKGYLNEKGYKALETLEGLDLFWVFERPQGKWITVKQDTILGTFEVKNKVCDQCNHATKYEYPFCPWCGERMKGGVE